MAVPPRKFAGVPMADALAANDWLVGWRQSSTDFRWSAQMLAAYVIGEAAAVYLTPEAANANYVGLSLVGEADGVASLDAGGKIPTAQLPPLALTEIFVVASQGAMLALDAQPGDVAIRTDESKSYGLAGDPTELTDWKELLSPTGGSGVVSFNSRTGAVAPQAGDYAQGDITGLTTSSSPQFAGINVGHVSDTTIGRTSAGILNVEGVDLVTVSATQTLTSKTLTAPRFADLGFIADANGNELLVFDLIASAVNEITIGNATNNNHPFIAATGGSTNINLNLIPKGSGAVQANGVNLVTVSSTDMLTNKTLTADKQTVHARSASGTHNISLADGNVQRCPTNANATINLPAATVGTVLILYVEYGGSHSVTFGLAGGNTLRWTGNSAPASTSTNGRIDCYIFVCAVANQWRGVDGGRNI